jgi:hypothetical protein
MLVTFDYCLFKPMYVNKMSFSEEEETHILNPYAIPEIIHAEYFSYRIRNCFNDSRFNENMYFFF